LLECFDSSFGCGAEQRLEFGESQFNGVEIWAVGRQVDQLSAPSFDSFAYASRFVSGQVIHDHDVSGPERRGQLLLDVGPKGCAVHGTVDHRRRNEAPGPQRPDERSRLPVGVRHFSDHSAAASGSTVETRHLGVRARFVEKYQLLRMKMRLPESPEYATLGYIGTILLSSMQDFF
jgi:hypothetical protein